MYGYLAHLLALFQSSPSRRIVLPSRLDGTDASLKDIQPGGGVDSIVSRRLEEVGQHILRVEVGYMANGAKTLRKFYRFNVTVPLNITETVVRKGDASCLVSITVENVMEKQSSGGGAVTISSVGFEPHSGLVAEQINIEEDSQGETTETDDIMTARSDLSASPRKSTVELYDSCGRLEPGEINRYLFSVTAGSEAAALRGIAFGDELGRAYLIYYKAMGESGKLFSSMVVCPPTSFAESISQSNFVVHRSGLSVDVAAASAQRSSSSGRRSSNESPGCLDELLPVTVEPIEPPSTMKLSIPEKVALLIVNHSSQSMNLQLQMRLPNMNGVVVCGPSFVNLGDVPPSGGSCTIDVNLIALVAGLFSVQGCYIVDMTNGLEIKQPALFDVFVELPENVNEEKKSGTEDIMDF